MNSPKRLVFEIKRTRAKLEEEEDTLHQIVEKIRRASVQRNGIPSLDINPEDEYARLVRCQQKLALSVFQLRNRLGEMLSLKLKLDLSKTKSPHRVTHVHIPHADKTKASTPSHSKVMERIRIVKAKVKAIEADRHRKVMAMHAEKERSLQNRLDKLQKERRALYTSKAAASKKRHLEFHTRKQLEVPTPPQSPKRSFGSPRRGGFQREMYSDILDSPVSGFYYRAWKMPKKVP